MHAFIYKCTHSPAHPRMHTRFVMGFPRGVKCKRRPWADKDRERKTRKAFQNAFGAYQGLRSAPLCFCMHTCMHALQLQANPSRCTHGARMHCCTNRMHTAPYTGWHVFKHIASTLNMHVYLAACMHAAKYACMRSNMYVCMHPNHMQAIDTHACSLNRVSVNATWKSVAR